MYLSFFDGRLVTKSYGIRALNVLNTDAYMMVNMTIGSESSMLQLENYQDKWFVVENAEAGVDCHKHRVTGLKVAQCKGNLRVDNFFG